MVAVRIVLVGLLALGGCGLLLLGGCGRLAFEVHDDAGDDLGSGASQGFACNTSRTLIAPAVVPIDVALNVAPTEAIAAWSDGSPTLAAIRFDLATDARAMFSAARPFAVSQLGLIGEGDSYLIAQPAGQGTGDVVFEVLDSELQTRAHGQSLFSHRVSRRATAAPSSSGGPFAAVWTNASSSEVTMVQIGRDGARTNPRTYSGSQAAEIRFIAQRYMLVWSVAPGGCAVFGLDDAFAPLLAAPRIHVPAGDCEQPAITRHASSAGIIEGTNLLTWRNGAALHGQLGTDTETVGGDLLLASTSDASDIAVAPTGFFLAIADAGITRISHLRIADFARTPLVEISRLPGSPLSLRERGDEALLLSVAADKSLQLTRICEP